ncbi:MAG: hypothetical protein FWG45_02030 [Oscillospiraceae bacterium]|nr:hypothetical protein [Oscillospiraceae bacterium]
MTAWIETAWRAIPPLPSLPVWLWVVIAAVGIPVLLLVVILSASVKAKVTYSGDFRVKVKYLGLTVFDSDTPPKPEKRKPKRSKHEPSPPERSQSQPEPSLTQRLSERSGVTQLAQDVSQANSRSFDFEMFKVIYDSMTTPLKRVAGKVKVRGLRLSCIVGGDDAFTIALTYGAQSAAISALLTWLNQILSLKVKQVTVAADFDSEKTQINMKFKAKLRVGTVVFIAGGLAFKYRKELMNMVSQRSGSA